MKMNTLTKVQFIPVDAGTCWDFFSDPSNLAKITPPEMGFKITSVLADMYPGRIITYQVRPVAGIPLTWVTEITQVKKGEYFVDEQRFGPYKFWHHKHFFREVNGGVEMTDIVHYALPLDPFSRVFLPVVRKKLEEIFRYRTKFIETEFNR